MPVILYRELRYTKSKFYHDTFQMSIHIHSYTLRGSLPFEGRESGKAPKIHNFLTAVQLVRENCQWQQGKALVGINIT